MDGPNLERRNGAILQLGCLVILAIMAAPVLRGGMYTDTDLANFHIPMRLFYAEALSEGFDYHWFPYAYAGFHLHGEGQAALYHPLGRLLYSSLPFQVAFGIDMLWCYPALLVGGVVLLRRLGLRTDASLFASALFAFGTFSTFHFMHMNVTAIVAHAPWIAWLADVLLSSVDRRRVAGAAVGVSCLVASCLLYSHPQFTWYVGLAVGVFVLARAVQGTGRARLPWLVVAVAVGFLIASVQLLPQWESLQLSFRDAPGLGFLVRITLSPIHLAAFAAPHLFVDDPASVAGLAIRAGGLVPVLLVWLLVRKRRHGGWERATGWLAASAALALVLSFGAKTWLGRLLILVPVVGLFRAPERHLMLFQIAVSVLAGLALADLAARDRDAPRPSAFRLAWLFVPGIVAAIVTAAVASGHLFEVRDRHIAPPALLVLGVLLPLGFAVGIALVARGHRGLLPLVLAVAMVELGADAVRPFRTTGSEPLERFVDELGPRPEFEGDRIHALPQSWLLHDLRLVNGYAAMVPDRQLEIYKPLVHRLVLKPPRHQIREVEQQLRVAGVGMAMGWALVEPLPRFRLLSRSVLEAEDVAAQVEATAVETVAIVDADLALDPAEPGEVRVLEETPGRFGFEVYATGRQLLVVAEAHHPGWRARIDGRPVPIVRVYGDFMGVVVSKDDRRVELRFDPDSTARGRALSIAGLLLLLPLGFGVQRFAVASRTGSARPPA